MNEVLLPEQLLETTNSNELTIKHEIGQLIKALEDEIDKANENKDKLRAAILTAMQNSNIYQAKLMAILFHKLCQNRLLFLIKIDL